MTAVILIGIPASGKSTFCKERLFSTHVRLSLDMLKTRHREELLFQACLAAKQPVVIDNTNATATERRRYIVPAKETGFRVVGYYFSSRIGEALERNRQRTRTVQIPDKAVLGIAGRLELPVMTEGFDELWYVTMDGNGGFSVEEWCDAL